ncbi:MAG: hypothetical protein ACJ76F_11340, partial [Bacteroidia bacterium]
ERESLELSADVWALLEKAPEKYSLVISDGAGNPVELSGKKLLSMKEKGNLKIAEKLYYLNKALHGVDIYYTAQLPEIFLFVHPIGSVIGRALFSDYFICYQGVTVGCLNDGIFPEFKGPAILYSNSSVLGKCIVGKNVCIAANTSVANQDISDDTIVIARDGKNTLSGNNKTVFQRPPFVYGS